jgi:hypothetical protein
MQNYKVTGSVAIFGVGMVLKLTKSQAETRTSSLKKKSKDHYVVLASIQFKKGEEISVISGNVSKSILKNLSNLSDFDKKPDQKAQNDDNKTPKKNQKTTSDDDEDSGDQKIQDQIVADGNDINNLPNV